MSHKPGYVKPKEPTVMYRVRSLKFRGLNIFVPGVSVLRGYSMQCSVLGVPLRTAMLRASVGLFYRLYHECGL